MIVAFDPGATTGVCSVSSLIQSEFTEVSWAQLVSLNDIWRWLSIWKPTVIIYERFDKTAKYAELAPVEVIGVLKLYSQQQEIPIYEQSRSIKKLWDNDKLKKLGGYCIGLPHATDAARHLLNYLVLTEGHTQILQTLMPSPDSQ